MSLRDVAMNNFEWDQAKGSRDLSLLATTKVLSYSAMKEVKSGATKYPASLTYIL